MRIESDIEDCERPVQFVSGSLSAVAEKIKEFQSSNREMTSALICPFRRSSNLRVGLDSVASILQNRSVLVSTDCKSKAGVLVLHTVHSSKGLEFDAVFTFNLSSHFFPYNPCTAEEQRNAIFVAMTRAKKRLFVVQTPDADVNSIFEPVARMLGVDEEHSFSQVVETKRRKYPESLVDIAESLDETLEARRSFWRLHRDTSSLACFLWRAANSHARWIATTSL